MTAATDSPRGIAWRGAVHRVIAWLRTLRGALSVLAVLAIAFCRLSLPDFTGHDIDGSMMQALSYFFKHDFQAGKDYLSTHGPLGCLWTRAYDSDLFALRLSFEVVLQLIVAIVLVAASGRLGGRMRQGLYWGILLLHPDPGEHWFIAT